MLYSLIITKGDLANLETFAKLLGRSLDDQPQINNETLTIIEIESTVLRDDVCIADGNAAAQSTQIYGLTDCTQVIQEQEEIKQRAQSSRYSPWISWNTEPELQSKLMAECLVPYQVDTSHIRRLFVASEDVANFLQNHLTHTDYLQIKVNERLFSRLF